MSNSCIAAQMASIGIHLGPTPWDSSAKEQYIKSKYTMDAFPAALGGTGLAPGALITGANNDVPAWLTQYFDPMVIEIFTARMAAEEIANPIKKGSYGTMSTVFRTVERTGGVAPYGDYSTEGRASYNTGYPQRDAFYFQSILEVGDMELAIQGMGRIDAAGEKQRSVAKSLKIAHNAFWFYGVNGLRNYGMLNDPGLNPALTPGTGTGGTTWNQKTTKEIYNDVKSMVQSIVTKSGNKIRSDDELILALSGEKAINLNDATDFNVSAWAMIKQAFPNMRYVTAPEYDFGTALGGQAVQLIAPSVSGQPTMELGYVELQRGHQVVPNLSSFAQKNSAGTYGAVIYQPFAIATMIGI